MRREGFGVPVVYVLCWSMTEREWLEARPCVQAGGHVRLLHCHCLSTAPCAHSSSVKKSVGVRSTSAESCLSLATSQNHRWHLWSPSWCQAWCQFGLAGH